MFKRILCLALICVMAAIAMVACGGDDVTTTPNATTTTPKKTTTTEIKITLSTTTTEAPGEGDTPELAYIIDTADKLADTATWSTMKYVKLGADIDMTGKTYVPAKTFAGSFDGAGHVISGLTVDNKNATPYVDAAGKMQAVGGFIDLLTGDSTIKNLGLIFDSLTLNDASVSETKDRATAGLLFGNAGTIEAGNPGYTHAKHTINVENVTLVVKASNITPRYQHRVGGICGYTNAIINVKNTVVAIKGGTSDHTIIGTGPNMITAENYIMVSDVKWGPAGWNHGNAYTFTNVYATNRDADNLEHGGSADGVVNAGMTGTVAFADLCGNKVAFATDTTTWTLSDTCVPVLSQFGADNIAKIQAAIVAIVTPAAAE